MICPKCHHEQPDGELECRKCGIIFKKIRNSDQESVIDHNGSDIQTEDIYHASVVEYAKALLTYVEPEINPFYFGGRAFVYLFLFIWSFWFIFNTPESNYAGKSYMHLINLPFHEAGHLIFGVFGKFIGTLGGTIGQLLMPLICFVTLLIKTRDTFGASVTLWWLGESFIDIAPYINDARALKLILLGGVTGKETVNYHDWEYILRHLGMLKFDHALAWTAQISGIFLMFIFAVWGGYLLLKQLKRIK